MLQLLIDTPQYEIVKQILDERSRQDQIHGNNNHSPERWLVILMEEIGEVSMAVNDKDPQQYRVELIHVAAVAMAAMEHYDNTMKELNHEPKTESR